MLLISYKYEDVLKRMLFHQQYLSKSRQRFGGKFIQYSPALWWMRLHLRDEDSKKAMQFDIDALVALSKKWQLPFNVGKCKCRDIYTFFYRQLDFSSEPGVANEILENEPKRCLTVA